MCMFLSLPPSRRQCNILPIVCTAAIHLPRQMEVLLVQTKAPSLGGVSRCSRDGVGLKDKKLYNKPPSVSLWLTPVSLRRRAGSAHTGPPKTYFVRFGEPLYSPPDCQFNTAPLQAPFLLIKQKNTTHPNGYIVFLVRETGLEPVR